MTSIYYQGKYRQRRDWSTSSIPELVSLEEEGTHIVAEIPTTLPPKAPRRSSLGIGLLVGGRGSGDSKYKRRSSIATAFLGRQNKVIHCLFIFFVFLFGFSSALILIFSPLSVIFVHLIFFPSINHYFRAPLLLLCFCHGFYFDFSHMSRMRMDLSRIEQRRIVRNGRGQ